VQIGGASVSTVGETPLSSDREDPDRKVSTERSLYMLSMSTLSWILIGVAIVMLALFVAMKIKDK
jgi:hypothetical protein